MRRIPLAWMIVLAMGIALPLAAPAAGAETPPGAAVAGQPVPAAASPAATKGEVLTAAQVITALAAEGVGTYATPTSTTPLQPVTGIAVPIHVLKSQATLYADETTTGAGTLGSAVSSLLPMPAAPTGEVYAPFDYLLAAYATSTATPGEVLAGKLMGTQNWDQPGTVVFPDLVLVLFSADTVQAAGAAPATAAALRGAVAATPLAPPGVSLCATLSDWVSQGFNSVFNALTLSTSTTPVLNFLTGLWNSAVALARSSISNIASALTAPVLTALRTSLGVIGVVSWAISALRNLKVTSTATPAFNSFGVNPAPAATGTLVITVGDANGFDWPAAVSDCASQLGLTLPSLNDVVGKTVNWTLTAVNGVPTSTWCAGTASCVLAAEDSATTTVKLATDHTANFGYSTNTELADQAARGKLIKNDYALVKATVSVDASALTALIKGMVLGAVPGAVQVLVGPLFDSLTAGVLSQAANLAAPTTFRYIQIEHHQTPATLPIRSCKGLFSTADFPGTDEALAPSPITNGASDCLFTGGTDKDPVVAEDALLVYSGAAAADAFYQEEIGTFSGSPAAGIGDEAYIGTVCESSVCGPAGVVRVANDVLEVSSAGATGGSESGELSHGVDAICPLCQFPTASLP